MMRKTLLTAAAMLAASSPSAFAGAPIAPLSEVAPGQRCQGYSVVRGTDISSFDVEVVDVIDGVPGASGPRILVRVSGPAVDVTGIGPGFSGSPILCRNGAGVDRTIGAISESIGDYGGKLVLARPIESMLAKPISRPAEPARTSSAKRTQALRQIRAHGVRSLAAPLTIAGLSPQLGKALERAGQRLGKPVIAVPAGPLGNFPQQTLQPGAALGVGLSDGDLRMGAVGTVTYVDGDRVWAFGHAMDAAGTRSLLLQDAYVYSVVNEPNAMLSGGSYKLAVPGHVLGTLTGDNLAAVGGVTGIAPPMIPLRVIAEDLDSGHKQVLNTRVADETDVGTPTGESALTSVGPLAVAQGVVSALEASPGRSTGRMCLRIVFRERPEQPARFCNRYATASINPMFGPLASAVAFEAGTDAATALSLLDSYEGEPVHVQSVEANVEVQRGRKLALLRGVQAPARLVPGRMARFRLRLQPVGGHSLTKTVRVRIPHVAPGPTRLKIKGQPPAEAGGGLIQMLLGGADTDRPTDKLATLGELTRQIEGVERWDGARLKLGGKTLRLFRSDEYVIRGLVRTQAIVRRSR